MAARKTAVKAAAGTARGRSALTAGYSLSRLVLTTGERMRSQSHGKSDARLARSEARVQVTATCSIDRTPETISGVL